jgi:mono/diheme cytochrome c family protein
VTEIPEHLLRRSKERRAALGLGGGEGAGDAPALATPAAAASEAPEAAAASEELEEAGLPAVVEEAPSYIAPAGPTRHKIPLWVMPVLVGMPLWAALYPAAFSNHTQKVVLTPLQDGARVYAAACSSCHGATGEGGVGPKLTGGEAKLTFPDVNDHIAWVQTGSLTKQGQKYGDPNRAGGQHVASKADMPAFNGTLTAQQIADVVQYEREQL